MPNIYLLTQNDNEGYDTVSSCVVVAHTAEEAKRIHPFSTEHHMLLDWTMSNVKCWALPDRVNVELLGECTNEKFPPGSVLCYDYTTS